MEELVGILVYLLGLGLLFLELFIPSGGILGIVGTLCTIYGIWQMFRVEEWLGVAVVFVTAGYAYGVLRFWAKRIRMNVDLGGSDSHTAEASPTDIVGKEGTTLTMLRPAGFASIDGTRYQVVTEGGYLSRGQKVKVVQVTGNRIVVTGFEEPRREEDDDEAL